jgi:hypothetical protein
MSPTTHAWNDDSSSMRRSWTWRYVFFGSRIPHLTSSSGVAVLRRDGETPGIKPPFGQADRIVDNWD